MNKICSMLCIKNLEHHGMISHNLHSIPHTNLNKNVGSNFSLHKKVES